MSNYTYFPRLLKRLLSSVAVVFIVVSFIYIMIRLAPGDPSLKFISPELSLENFEKVRESFQLDQNIFDQYIAFVGNLLSGDLGISYVYNMPVLDVISLYLPFTIIFSITVFSFQLVISFILAIISAKRTGNIIDKFISKSALLMYAVPPFVSGLILILIFSVNLNWLPISGIGSIENSSFGFLEKLLDHLKHLILPVITLSFALFPVYHKYLRENLDNLFDASFVLNLKSYGLSNNQILVRHIIPNALNPIIAIAGIDLGILLGGSLLTEVIFGLPGMGRLTVHAIFSRDYPLIIGCCLSASIFTVMMTFFADVLRSLIDKRLWKGLIN